MQKVVCYGCYGSREGLDASRGHSLRVIRWSLVRQLADVIRPSAVICFASFNGHLTNI